VRAKVRVRDVVDRGTGRGRAAPAMDAPTCADRGVRRRVNGV